MRSTPACARRAGIATRFGCGGGPAGRGAARRTRRRGNAASCGAAREALDRNTVIADFLEAVTALFREPVGRDSASSMPCRARRDFPHAECVAVIERPRLGRRRALERASRGRRTLLQPARLRRLPRLVGARRSSAPDSAPAPSRAGSRRSGGACSPAADGRGSPRRSPARRPRRPSSPAPRRP